MSPASPTTVTQRLRAHAARMPQRCALDDGRRQLSYGELVAGMEQLARGLCLAGRHRAGPPLAMVGLLLDAPLALLESFCAATLAGAAAMVLDPAWSAAELRAVLTGSPPDLLLTDRAGAARVAGLLPAAAVHLVDDPGSILRAAPPDTPLPDVAPTAAFYVGFTSGTTGTPKGFVRDHASWVHSFELSAPAFGITPGDPVVACGPLQHSLFCYAALHGLWAGAQVHVRPRFSPSEVLALLTKHPGSALFAVPTMLLALVRAATSGGDAPGDGQGDAPGDASGTVTGVRTVICSGAPLSDDDQRRVEQTFPGAALVEFFGASELSFVALRRGGDGTPPGSVGSPLPGVEVVIRDDAGRPLPPGQVGHVTVRSPLLFSGYLHDGALAGTASKRWTDVGDRGWCDADGHLFVLGRDGNMVLTGGFNVYPEEVEAVLRELHQVADVAVVGLPDATRGELLCAVVVWHDQERLPRSALRAHCRSRLAPAKRPRRYLAAEALPRTPSGKTARAQLRIGLLTGTFAAEPL